MTDSIDVLYRIWQTDDSSTAVSPESAPVIDRAMKLWGESRRDSWITVQAPTGAEISILASTIVSSMLTTPQQRADATRQEKAIDDERKENRRVAGWIESE